MLAEGLGHRGDVPDPEIRDQLAVPEAAMFAPALQCCCCKVTGYFLHSIVMAPG